MNSWVTGWEHALGLPPALPAGVVASIAALVLILVVILPACAVVTYIERKLGADLQARVGPNRAGPAGVLQPFADLFKAAQKDISPKSGRRDLVWLLIQVMALYSTLAVLPLGSTLILVDTDMSVFLPFLATLVVSLGTMLLGLSQGAVPGWFGGLRIAAQTFAGAFPALMALLCAGIRAGGFHWNVIAESQGASPLHWPAFGNPFQFFAFFVFMISGMVLLSVAPFNSGLSLNDLHRGVSSRLHGRWLSLFNLGRFYGFFLWCMMAAVLFLGGWRIPEAVADALREGEAWRSLQILEALVLLIKTILLMLIVSLTAKVTPRVRADQVTDFALKVLSPFALAALAGAALTVGWGAIL